MRGFFCNPQAIGAITGLPLTAPVVPGNTLQQATVTLPDVNVAIQINMWFSLASRTFWTTFDMMCGASLLDETAGQLLQSA